MIKSVTIKKDKDSVIYDCWGARTFKFTDGVNIIFGQNGCGKSVLMDTIARYLSIADGRGWTTFLTPHDVAGWNFDKKIKDYLGVIESNKKHGFIKMDWDGVPAYKSEVQRDEMQMLTNLMQGGAREELSLSEAIALKTSNGSSGEKVNHFLSRLLKMQTPDIAKFYGRGNDTWKFYGEMLPEYIKNLPRDGKPTLLMDEPDKSLDFATQRIFWEKFVDELSKKYQVIIVTHSVFALARIGDNIIDKDNYFQKSREFVKKAFKI